MGGTISRGLNSLGFGGGGGSENGSTTPSYRPNAVNVVISEDVFDRWQYHMTNAKMKDQVKPPPSPIAEIDKDEMIADSQVSDNIESQAEPVRNFQKGFSKTSTPSVPVEQAIEIVEPKNAIEIEAGETDEVNKSGGGGDCSSIASPGGGVFDRKLDENEVTPFSPTGLSTAGKCQEIGTAELWNINDLESEIDQASTKLNSDLDNMLQRLERVSERIPPPSMKGPPCAQFYADISKCYAKNKDQVYKCRKAIEALSDCAGENAWAKIQKPRRN